MWLHGTMYRYWLIFISFFMAKMHGTVVLSLLQRVAWYHAWYHYTVTAQLFLYLFHFLHAYVAKRCMVPLYSHCCNFFSTWLWYAFVAKRCMVSLYSHCCNFFSTCLWHAFVAMGCMVSLYSHCCNSFII